VYLYENAHADALERLRGLEQIEDDFTIAALERLPRLEGISCLEIGAGAGSIAAWLSARVGKSGKVLATDIDPTHLDSSKYNVLQHDIQKDEMPAGKFDLVHLRHVLVHLSDPISVLAKIRSSMKDGAHLLVEESDLRSWGPLTPHLRAEFQKGVSTVLELYASRGMNIALGGRLVELLSDSGFAIVRRDVASRTVSGGTAEAAYQELSTRQLASSVAMECPEVSRELTAFCACFRDPGLRYKSRTTVSVAARRT
jgi:ubiquinone/menaquinone biosynthesis C-methylase UbiE